MLAVHRVSRRHIPVPGISEYVHPSSSPVCTSTSESVHFVLCIVRCVLYIVRCALCSLHMYVLCILYEVQYCLLRTVVDIVCCVYRVPGTVLIRILCMLCTVYCAVCVAEEPSKSRGTKEQAPEAVSHPTRMMTLFQWAIL